MAATAESVSVTAKPRRQRKETQLKIDEARREGFEMGRIEGARTAAPPMLTSAIVWSAGMVIGMVIGAWLF